MLWHWYPVPPPFLQICATILHLGRFYTKSEWLTAALAVQSILLVFRLQFFTQAFQAVRISYLPIIKEVWSDLRPAFYLMLLVMWGFACAFNIALRRDQDAQEVGGYGRSRLLPVRYSSVHVLLGDQAWGPARADLVPRSVIPQEYTIKVKGKGGEEPPQA